MQVYKFITLFVFLFICIKLNAQDSKTIVNINDDGEKIEFAMINGEVLKFKVNGKDVDYAKSFDYLSKIKNAIFKLDQPVEMIIKDDNQIYVNGERFEDFKALMKDTEEKSKDFNYESMRHPEPRDVNDELHYAIIDLLTESMDVGNTERYIINVRDEYASLNGKRISPELHEVCKFLFEDIIDMPFTAETKVKIKVKKGQTSVSVTQP